MTVTPGHELHFDELPGRDSADPLLGLGAASSIRIVRLHPGRTRQAHRHPHSEEIVYVRTGHGTAFLDGIRNAGPQILEPIVSVDVTVPGDYMGDITGNLASRRARISGTESLGGNLVTVRADMPLSSLTDYHTELKSMTQGTGTFTMEFSHYDPVPHDVQQKLEADYKPRDSG